MKIYNNNVKESWIIDRVNDEWKKYNPDIATEKIKNSDIIWIIANWVWKKTPKRHLYNKKVVSSVYHIDFEKFDSAQEKDFYALDQFVDIYHVISLNTKNQLSKLTDKKIISLPFWINQNNWFYIDNKKQLREELGYKEDDFIVGSFQRDTEGDDLKSPKLIKGPDVLVEILDELNQEKQNLKVVLAGTRRQYVIDRLQKLSIEYKYFEMADLRLLNNLYNILNLYLVTSRLEGGPQAILESAITKTPILSTDVGVAKEILHKDSLFTRNSFKNSKTNISYAYENSQNYTIPKGMDGYRKMFKEVYES